MKSIRETVDELARAQQQGDAAALAALFTPDAVRVTAESWRPTGSGEINALTHSLLPEATRESAAVYEVALVVFVRPDVAVVSVRERPVTRDDQTADGRSEGRPLFVMTREDGRWLIAVGQNTLVREP